MTERKMEGLAVKAFKIGDKIKELRQKHRYTIQDMTAKTGLPQNILTQIENNEIVPPVATLLTLATALQVGMVYFFQDTAGSQKIAVTRKNERVRIERRPHHQNGEVNYIYETLEAKKTNKHMEPFIVEFPRLDTADMIFVSHKGEEFLHVLEGKLEFRSVEEVHVLDPGDSIYFESDIAHSFRCLGEQTARAIVVVYHKE